MEGFLDGSGSSFLETKTNCSKGGKAYTEAIAAHLPRASPLGRLVIMGTS